MTTRTANVTLWILQIVLAALFVFAGVAKLAMPADLLARQVPLPVAFMRFIAIAELAGAAGLVLPGLFRIHAELTPLAAAGLVIIMTGATVISAVTAGAATAIAPAIVGLVAIGIAYGRAGLVSARESGGTRYAREAHGHC